MLPVNPQVAQNEIRTNYEMEIYFCNPSNRRHHCKLANNQQEHFIDDRWK
ncbi:hypothetical protein GCM10022216_15840 [Sphingobacterium kyonggiense]|uniref:Integrase-like protein n=1 Tax=Sphingobacterium kyonggiense TaxID=714075 RepID=A0ABP7YMY6_9SPHI